MDGEFEVAIGMAWQRLNLKKQSDHELTPLNQCRDFESLRGDDTDVSKFLQSLLAKARRDAGDEHDAIVAMARVRNCRAGTIRKAVARRDDDVLVQAIRAGVSSSVSSPCVSMVMITDRTGRAVSY